MPKARRKGKGRGVAPLKLFKPAREDWANNVNQVIETEWNFKHTYSPLLSNPF